MRPTDDPTDPAVLHWQRLVDTGLIGTRHPAPPAIVAQRAANDALFRRIAAARRGRA